MHFVVWNTKAAHPTCCKKPLLVYRYALVVVVLPVCICNWLKMNYRFYHYRLFAKTLWSYDDGLETRSCLILLLFFRVFVLMMLIFSILWIPIIQVEEGGQLFTYIQKISAHLQPPIAACFVLGIFLKKTNEKVCMAFC